MLGNLYIITNKVTGLQYVGKTYDTLTNRFKQHCSEIEKHSKRPLYAAMKEFGVECFDIELVAQYEEGELEFQEEILISKLGTFVRGYNATLGGQGKRSVSYSDEEIYAVYQELKSTKKTAAKLGISATPVTQAIRRIEPNIVFPNIRPCKIVELDKTFPSVSECAIYFQTLELTTTNLNSIRTSINRALSGKRKSYLGYTFIYESE